MFEMSLNDRQGNGEQGLQGGCSCEVGRTPCVCGEVVLI